MSGRVLRPISDAEQAKRGWSLRVNGVEIKDIKEMSLSNARFGALHYGLTPGGWDGWVFEETGGGGSVIVPFAEISGVLHIGLVQQRRDNQQRTVANLPRGFIDPGEDHFAAATRELEEEMGKRSKERIFQLDGEPCNPNSAFFVTLGDEGVKFFGCRVMPDELEPAEKGRYVFRKGTVKPATKSAEQIFGSVFVPWHKAVQVSDMFTLAGIARLLPLLS